MRNRQTKKYKPGSVFTTSKNQTLVIRNFSNHSNVEIEILDTGTILTVDSTNIRKGSVKDPMFPTIAGVGYLGIGKHQATLFNDGLGIIHNPLYLLWRNMINRVFVNKGNNIAYKDCTVCDRWLCFQHFADDVKELEGYEDWIKGAAYDFDKDAKQVGVKHKIYSPSTCAFVPVKVNRGSLKSNKTK